MPSESQVHRQMVRKRSEARDIVRAPSTMLLYVAVAEPDMQHTSGDLERLCDALHKQWQLVEVMADLAMRRTAGAS